ncbi:XVIPCD domain-containing protein [Stenotrophomonas sp. TWI700]|uniref:XVIPCD domain-containing protein n=1 Tax=Stenotrophomonas sp. TWI700 TaxID=3136792 RepID=UPI003208853D
MNRSDEARVPQDPTAVAWEPVAHSVESPIDHGQAAPFSNQPSDARVLLQGKFHTEPFAAQASGQASPVSQSERQAQEVATSPVVPTEQASPQQATTASTDAEPWSPVNPPHPQHALYQQIRQEVTALDVSHGRSYDQTSERVTGGLLVMAKSNGLDRVDHVVLSRPTADQAGGHKIFVVQGEMNNPSHLRASMPTDQAVKTPFDQSMAQFDVAMQQQEQARHLSSQRETEERQQEVKRSAMSFG